MVRLGLIRKQWFGWIFSGTFKSVLEKLIELVELYKVPADPPTQLHEEQIYIDMEKDIKIDNYQR